MALYSVSVKPVSRSSGRSATAAASYRNAERMTNERTGEIHDYTRRSGVDHVESFAPSGMAPMASSELWNKAEAAEVRSNARVAREVLVALPHELDQVQRRDLAKSIAQDLADRYGTAGTLAIHQPDREGDNRNHHVHILMTTRRLDADGQLGEKTRELDDIKRGPQEVEWIRGAVERQTNHALERAGLEHRVDKRSLALQHRSALEAGDLERAALLNRPATMHEGPRVTQIRREAVRAGRPPLGTLDRAAANDHSRQLVADRAELDRVSAQIYDFERARQARAAQENSFLCAPPLPGRYEEQVTVRLLDKEALLARLSWEKRSDNSVLYRLNHEAAFIDRGQRLDMAPGASQSDEKVTAALLTAANFYDGHIELSGSEAFKAKTIALIARHELNVTMKDPDQQALLDAARKALQEPTAHAPGTAERPPVPEDLKQTVAQGMAEARARFELSKQVEQGKQEAREAFKQFQAQRDSERHAERERQQILAADRMREQEAQRLREDQSLQQKHKAPDMPRPR